MWTLARATASEQLLVTNVLRVTTRLGLSVEALCIVSDTCEDYPKKCRGRQGALRCHPPHSDNHARIGSEAARLTLRHYRFESRSYVLYRMEGSR
jgi:hypothetical protein